MSSGTIADNIPNRVLYGGGGMAENTATFTMTGGAITGISQDQAAYMRTAQLYHVRRHNFRQYCWHQAVAMSYGTVTMTGGRYCGKYCTNGGGILGGTIVK